MRECGTNSSHRKHRLPHSIVRKNFTDNQSEHSRFLHPEQQQRQRRQEDWQVVGVDRQEVTHCACSVVHSNQHNNQSQLQQQASSSKHYPQPRHDLILPYNNRSDCSSKHVGKKIQFVTEEGRKEHLNQTTHVTRNDKEHVHKHNSRQQYHHNQLQSQTKTSKREHRKSRSTSKHSHHRQCECTFVPPRMSSKYDFHDTSDLQNSNSCVSYPQAPGHHHVNHQVEQNQASRGEISQEVHHQNHSKHRSKGGSSSNNRCSKRDRNSSKQSSKSLSTQDDLYYNEFCESGASKKQEHLIQHHSLDQGGSGFEKRKVNFPTERSSSTLLNECEFVNKYGEDCQFSKYLQGIHPNELKTKCAYSERSVADNSNRKVKQRHQSKPQHQSHSSSERGSKHCSSDPYSVPPGEDYYQCYIEYSNKQQNPNSNHPGNKSANTKHHSSRLSSGKQGTKQHHSFPEEGCFSDTIDCNSDEKPLKTWPKELRCHFVSDSKISQAKCEPSKNQLPFEPPSQRFTDKGHSGEGIEKRSIDQLDVIEPFDPNLDFDLEYQLPTLNFTPKQFADDEPNTVKYAQINHTNKTKPNKKTIIFDDTDNNFNATNIRSRGISESHSDNPSHNDLHEAIRQADEIVKCTQSNDSENKGKRDPNNKPMSRVETVEKENGNDADKLDFISKLEYVDDMEKVVDIHVGKKPKDSTVNKVNSHENKNFLPMETFKPINSNSIPRCRSPMEPPPINNNVANEDNFLENYTSTASLIPSKSPRHGTDNNYHEPFTQQQQINQDSSLDRRKHKSSDHHPKSQNRTVIQSHSDTHHPHANTVPPTTATLRRSKGATTSVSQFNTLERNMAEVAEQNRRAERQLESAAATLERQNNTLRHHHGENTHFGGRGSSPLPLMNHQPMTGGDHYRSQTNLLIDDGVGFQRPLSRSATRATVFEEPPSKGSIFKLASIMYAMLLVAICITFLASEVSTSHIPLHYFEGFFSYCYLFSIVFLLYVFCFLLHETACCGRPPPTNQMVKHNVYLKNLPKDALPNGSPFRERMVSMKKPRKYKISENDFSHGSFFLRLGAVLFGIVGIIYNGIELTSFFQIPFNSPCYQVLRGINPILQIIFTFSQLYFLFLNARLNIQRCKSFSRLGLAHVIATNVCVLIRTLVKECVKIVAKHRSRLGLGVTEDFMILEGYNSLTQKFGADSFWVVGPYRSLVESISPDGYINSNSDTDNPLSPFYTIIDQIAGAAGAGRDMIADQFFSSNKPTVASLKTGNGYIAHSNLSTSPSHYFEDPQPYIDQSPGSQPIYGASAAGYQHQQHYVNGFGGGNPSMTVNYAPTNAVDQVNTGGRVISNGAGMSGGPTIYAMTPYNFTCSLNPPSHQTASSNFRNPSSFYSPGFTSSPSLIQDVVTHTSPYLYPFLMQYSIIAAFIMFALWRNVGRNPRFWGQDDDHISVASRKIINYAKTDCVGASKGLFFGILTLLCGLICLVLFFVLIEHDNIQVSQLAIFLADSSHCVILIFSILATLIGFIRIQYLKFHCESSFSDKLRNGLLVFAACGILTYSMFNVIAGGFGANHSDVKYLLIFASGVLTIIQVLLQLVFITDIQRRRISTTSQNSKKPCRQVVTFLLLTNITMWIIYVMDVQKVSDSPIQIKFYGFTNWTIIQRSTLPICIFFRFFSSVLLGDVWKNTYKTKLFE